MKPVSGKNFAKVLERKGWVLKRVKGSHHVYAKEGNAARLSVPIHGTKPLKVGLLRHLMRLAGLEPEDID